MDRLSVLCFAGTYGLALASDLARLVLPDRARKLASGLAIGLIVAAWVVQTAYLGNLLRQTGGVLVSSPFESLLALSWVLGAIHLYFLVRLEPWRATIRIFLLPVLLGVITAAGWLAPREDWSAYGGWLGFWGTTHGLMLTVGAVASVLGFVAGLMYLIQDWRLKNKWPGSWSLPLPSLEQSERWNQVALTVAFPLLSFGIGIGLAIEWALRTSQRTMVAWTDPKVISGLLMWVAFTLVLHARFFAEVRGRRVMVLTAVAFALLLFTFLGVDLLLPTRHGANLSAGSAGGMP